MTCKASVAAAIAFGLCAFNAAATPVVTSLTPSPVGAHPVGTTITWTAAASDADSGALWYRFSVGPHNGTLRVAKDYSPSTSFEWTPVQNEGQFDIEVSAENSVTKNKSGTCLAGNACIQAYTVTSRVSGAPLVTATRNSLVALYSAPACPAGSGMRVRFRPATPVYRSDNYDQTTPTRPCNGMSMNFYIAGMRANTTYVIRHDLFSGPRVITGPSLTFTTGNVPFTLPHFTVVNPPQLPTSLTNSILLQSVTHTNFELATDVYGNPVWYFLFPTVTREYITFPVSGGGVFYIVINSPQGRTQQFLRQIDLAGNVVLETNAAAISDRLVAKGQQPISAFHHDARYMPNGDILLLGSVERLFTDGTQGSSVTHPVDVQGDMILVLDPNFNVVWTWNSFDHLNVKRAAVLGETCQNSAANCPTLFLAQTGNDWTHGNAVQLLSDGNILYSSRHQDFVYKIDYRNGSGTGNLIWTMGNGGDFTISPNNPSLWFSHQHDPDFQFGGTRVMSVFDNGNTRIRRAGTGNSRGQVYNVDEAHKSVTLPVNVDLGVYSVALGMAQPLPNGNYHFDAGEVPSVNTGADAFEYAPSGTLVYHMQIRPTNSSTNLNEYRSFRMRDLYTAP